MDLERTERFKRQYRKLPRAIKDKVNARLSSLEQMRPGAPHRRIKKMTGQTGVWEYRVDDDYRMTLEFQGSVVRLRNVDSHDACLRSP
jgi:mRNA-degrading endonuclease RelE of RelBE toxin-antitoxin system